mgnify:CR=1 FL=1
MKEVEEETGILAEPVSLLGVVDGMRMGFSRFGMYMLLFHCRATGGSLVPHGGQNPIEAVKLNQSRGVAVSRLCETGRLRAYENAYLLERATARARKQLAALRGGAPVSTSGVPLTR